MKIKIHSNELNRMMKIIKPCLDTKSITKAVIRIVHEDNSLKIMATNGTFSAIVFTPLLGGDGESFGVDGPMMARVVNLCSGEVEISTDERSCTVKGTGRTKIPIVPVKLPEFKAVKGDSVSVLAEDFKYCFNRISYAIATENSRPMLTGAYIVTDGNQMEMVALDGFQMAKESTPATGGQIKVIIPGTFMNWTAAALENGEKMTMTTDGKRILAETDSMKLSCSLLGSEYIDYQRLLPETFETEAMIKVSQVQDALKSGSIVNNKQRLVKVRVDKDELTITSNSEEADYEANIPCEVQGKPILIAFNERYLMNTMNALDADEAVMKFNQPSSPIIVQGKA